jgi:hypothetical protein
MKICVKKKQTFQNVEAVFRYYIPGWKPPEPEHERSWTKK